MARANGLFIDMSCEIYLPVNLNKIVLNEPGDGME